jgi:hypothetical protein
MIFEIRKTRLRLILYILLLIPVATILFIAQAELPAILLLFVISLLMIFYYLKRVGIHEVMHLNKLLLVEQNVVEYLMIYEDINNRSYTKDERWIATKSHNLVLGYIFSGDLKKATTLLNKIEEKQGVFLKSYPVFNYMQHTLHMMLSILSSTNTQMKKDLPLYKQAFERNDDKTKEQISMNKKSFHNWILTMFDLLIESKKEEECLTIISDMQPTLKALAVFSLNNKKITNEDPKTYCKSCFFHIEA